MTKVFFLFALMAIQFSVFAGSLLCEKIECVDVQKPINTDSWCEGQRISGKVMLNSRSLKKSGDDLILDLSDGDQIYQYILDAKDVKKKTKNIYGEYQEGYWWDKRYIRFKIILDCEKLG